MTFLPVQLRPCTPPGWMTGALAKRRRALSLQSVTVPTDVTARGCGPDGAASPRSPKTGQAAAPNPSARASRKLRGGPASRVCILPRGWRAQMRRVV